MCVGYDWIRASCMVGYLLDTCKRILEDRHCNCKNPMSLARPGAYHLHESLSNKRNLPKSHVSSCLGPQSPHSTTHININMTPRHKPTRLTRQNTHTPFNSSGLPILPIGVIDRQCCISPSSNASRFSAVSIYPGAMTLQRIPCGAHSLANDFASWVTAALEAL